MIKKIVTGVDGSPTAGAAARVAAGMAETHRAELHVISAYGNADTERVSSDGSGIVLDRKEDARRALDDGVASLRGDFPGLVIDARLSDRRPAAGLVEFAEEIDADLIVVGNKRVQGISRVLGSIATEVARKAPCDVYIAHTQTHTRA